MGRAMRIGMETALRAIFASSLGRPASLWVRCCLRRRLSQPGQHLLHFPMTGPVGRSKLHGLPQVRCGARRITTGQTCDGPDVVGRDRWDVKLRREPR